MTENPENFELGVLNDFDLSMIPPYNNQEDEIYFDKDASKMDFFPIDVDLDFNEDYYRNIEQNFYNK